MPPDRCQPTAAVGPAPAQTRHAKRRTKVYPRRPTRAMDKFARWTSLTECGTFLEIRRGAAAGKPGGRKQWGPAQGTGFPTYVGIRRCLSPVSVEGCSNSGDPDVRRNGEKHAASEPVPFPRSGRPCKKEGRALHKKGRPRGAAQDRLRVVMRGRHLSEQALTLATSSCTASPWGPLGLL